MTKDEEIKHLQGILLGVYLEINKIPHQGVGMSGTMRMKEYLLKSKVMPAHIAGEALSRLYGLVDNSPNIKEVEKETKRLQQLANEARNKLKDEDTAYGEQ